MHKQAEERIYRIYVTDALKYIAENTAKYAGGSYLKARYIELIEPEPEPTETADEIISRLKKGLGELGVNDNGT